MLVNSKPLLTIITVVYNGVKTIEQTILSVTSQTFKDYEYIIIDGGSNDGTFEVIKKHQENLSYWISERDNGIYDAMNKGTLLANGEYVIYINSGDQILDVDYKFLRNEKNGDVFYGYIIDNLKKTKKPYDLKIINYAMPFCHQAAIIRTQLMRKYRFDTSYKIAADFDLFQRLTKDKLKFIVLPLTIAFFEGGGVSAEMNKLYLYEYVKIILKNRINYKWPISLLKFIFIYFLNYFKKL
jgi:glycosyltransferase involved in cell wall biosynthesis